MGAELSNKQLRHLMKNLDQDKSKEIDFDEFLKIIQDQINLFSNENPEI